MRYSLLALALLPVLVACGGEWSTLAVEPPPPSAPLYQSHPPERVVEGEGTPALLHLTRWQASYDVHGSTAAEVRASLDAAAPVEDGGARFDGATSWDLTWSFRYARENGLCSLASAVVRLDVVVILPALAGLDTLPPSMRVRWEAYTSALQTHEEGHRERQEAVARQLREALENPPGAMSCRELERHLEALGEAAKHSILGADLAYDIETGHGRLQGAVYP